MRQINTSDIMAMWGNGSSMRQVLLYFISKGATIYLVRETDTKPAKRFFLVEYEGLKIPLRSYKLNFYSTSNSILAQSVTSDKLTTYNFLREWSIPTPETLVYTDDFDGNALLKKAGTAVVKPMSGAHGDGITLNVKDVDSLAAAVSAAAAIKDKVLVQQQVDGDDHRLLFIDYKFVAAVKRLPATVRGDGHSTVRQIVEASNHKVAEQWHNIRAGSIDADSIRGTTSKIPIDEIISARGEAFLKTVPSDGEEIRVLDKANVSLGGRTYDCTDQVSAELTELISRLLRTIDLPLCGVDVLSTDISSSPDSGKSFVIEMNAAPGLRLHEQPYVGEPRNVCAQVVESLIARYRILDQ